MREGRALSASEVGAVVAHDDERRAEKRRKPGRPARTPIDKSFEELAVTYEFELLRGQGLSQEQAETLVGKEFGIGKSTIWARIGTVKKSVPAAAAIREMPARLKKRLSARRRNC